MADPSPVRQWDIFEAVVDPAHAETEGIATTPVLIVSLDDLNCAYDVVTVLPIQRASGSRRRLYAFAVQLPPETMRESAAHVVVPSQLRTISKRRLRARVGEVSDVSLQHDIEDRILEHLGHDPYDSD